MMSEADEFINALHGDTDAQLRLRLRDTRLAELPSPLAIDAELARRSYPEFVQQAWHVVEPATALVWNWHLDEICRHLEAVTTGTIRELLATVPPGHMKSLLVSVFWLPWVWLRRPAWRALFSSYALPLSIRDSVKSRAIIESDWYQQTFRPDWQLSGDQNVKGFFTNTKTGFRLALGVTGATTGFRGDAIIADDPLNAKDQLSETALAEVKFWWDQVYANRLNNLETGARVVIMQRLHQEDLAGHILSSQPGKWNHLMLPTEFDPARRCVTQLGVVDPRTVPGALLFPARFSQAVIDEERQRLGPVGFEGQHQQQPIPTGGSMFKDGDWRIVEAIPAGVVKWVRYWDAAGTEGGGDWTAGVKMGKLDDGRYVIADIAHGQWDSVGVQNTILNAAAGDGRGVYIREEQEGGSSGKAVIRSRATSLAGYMYEGRPATGDKATRATPLATQQQAHNVLLYKAPDRDSTWIQKFTKEAAIFPRGAHDDMIDAASGAFNELVGTRQAKVHKLAGF